MTNREIDWHSQWQLHGFQFHDGYVHIQFTKLGIAKQPYWRADVIRLAPGPGFGDFSHPTTRLTLKMMATIVHDQEVVDIGCGSGILTVAAIALGCKKATGIDIDPDAVKHTNDNLILNGFSQLGHAFLPGKKSMGTIAVMNMIRSEQQTAWNPNAYANVSTVITSGVLKEERTLYLAQTVAWGFTLIQEAELDGWMSFHFTRLIR